MALKTLTDYKLLKDHQNRHMVKKDFVWEKERGGNLVNIKIGKAIVRRRVER